MNISYVALCPALLVLCYGMFQYPRPQKVFWRLLLYYYGLVIFVKFAFQSSVFCYSGLEKQYRLAPDPGCFASGSTSFNLLGIYKTPEFTVFLNYIMYDALVIGAILFHRHVLLSRGLWEENELEMHERMAKTQGTERKHRGEE